MIKLIKNGFDGKYWKLEINGQIVEKVSFSTISKGLNLYASIKDSTPVLFEQTVTDFFSVLKGNGLILQIIVDLEEELDKEKKDLHFDALLTEDGKYIGDIGLFVVLNLEKEIFLSLGLTSLLTGLGWKRPFSALEYMEFLENDLTDGVDYSENVKGSMFTSIIFPLSDKNVTLLEAIQYGIERFKLSHQKAFEELSNKAEANSLRTRFFSFPEEIRTPCEQYLLYFAEFLRDLGISATTDIKHEAGEVLFSVTPSNPDQALDKIRVALEVYLKLHQSEIIIVPDKEFEIAMLKVKANIDHLNSQLSLAKAEIRVKEREIQALEATLESKDVSIEGLRERLNQQKRLLNGDISEGIIDIEPKTKEEDKVEFLDGVFALTQYEEKGFRVNLAQLYRKLKTYLKGE